MDDESPYIKTFIVEDTPYEKSFTQSGFVLALMPCKDTVGHESVKILEGEWQI